MEKPESILQLFQGRIAVINVGLETFAEHFPALGIEAIQVDWRPPAGGNPELLKQLKKLNQ